MANPEHLAILRQGVRKWNDWREENTELLHPDLSFADLSEMNLSDVKLAGGDLRAADLHGALFDGADLRGAELEKANISATIIGQADFHAVRLMEANLAETHFIRTDLLDAKLTRSDLHRAWFQDVKLELADLARANLREAGFSRVNLAGVNLAGADLHGTRVGWCLFADTDLRGVFGLDTVRHDGPSTIGIDTVLKSQGQIPESFLRGAGVPDTFIQYARSLVAQSIHFYSCFISYSTEDQEFARRLHADLQNNGVRCWFAPHDVRGGRKLHEQIDEAIRLYDRLLLILSDHSMNSEWVKTEIAHARQKELNEKRKVLFPISLLPFEKIRDWNCFDADTGKDSAREIREYFIPDFSSWKDHESYKQAFERHGSQGRRENGSGSEDSLRYRNRSWPDPHNTNCSPKGPRFGINGGGKGHG